ncbi:MAG: hypothetical protein KBC96_07240 [Armatimonadetes bacterium]|nr:hypothetical protein [Armatimonadota bacterium]
MIKYTTHLLTAAFCAATVASAAFAGGATVVYDFFERYPEAKISNAMSPGAKKAKSGGIERKSVFLHPTGAGDAVAEYEVTLPKLKSGEKLVLVCGVGLTDGIPANDSEHPYDGVVFELRINGRKEFETDVRDPGWREGASDLTSRAGKKIRVALVSRGKQNTNYDWANWGTPQIVRLSENVLDKDLAPVSSGLVLVKSKNDGTASVFPLAESGATLGESLTVPLAEDKLAAARFDFNADGAHSVRVSTSHGAAELGVYAFAPSLEIESFGPTSALIYRDRPATLRAVIRNVGEGDLSVSDGATVEFAQSAANDDGTPIYLGYPLMKKISAQPIGKLLSGERKVIECALAPDESKGILYVGAVLSTKDGGGPSAVRSVALVTPTTDPGPPGDSVSTRVFGDGLRVLQNPKLRILFLRSGDAFAAWTANIPKGDGWEQVASGSFGRLVTGEGEEQVLRPIESHNDADSVTLNLRKKVGNSSCSFEWVFKMEPDRPNVSISHSVKTDKPLDIGHFSGPMVCAGDGGFGARKDEGLFPGLEYLLTEQSSGTEFVHPPDNLRTVPHPNKVTIPLMAIRNGSTLVTLEWDPLQKWAAGTDRPASVFASPNFLDGQENHLMGIFAPSVPDYTPENRVVADRPFRLEAGNSLRLEATLGVRSESATILDAVGEWVARHGVPEPPETGLKPYEMMNLSEEAFLGTAWIKDKAGWNHTITGPVSFDAMIANYLYARNNRTYDAKKSEEIAAVVNPAIEAVRADLPLSTALYAGDVPAALTRAFAHAESLIKSQREDGSWAYTPDKEHEVFGTPGDTSSGLTALRSKELLEHALITGDATARDAGLKGLAFLDTTARPEGAQTWELPLHVPDILASAHLVTAYLNGYRITDEKRYLDRAVYWAKSGLPFVYLWSAADQPIMRYGTIPVFGSTWYDKQPWFGVIVQWCGLEYGYALDKLAEHDSSMPWKQIARGILHCAVQQQQYTKKEYPQNAGMYPDAFSPILGKEQYHWDINPRLIARNLMRELGMDTEPATQKVLDRQSQMLTLTLPAQSLKMNYSMDWIRSEFNYAVGATIYAVVSGVYRPESFELNGKAINLLKDISAAPIGWVYDEARTLSVVKMVTGGENKFVIDLINHEMRQAPGASVEKPTDPAADKREQPDTNAVE